MATPSSIPDLANALAAAQHELEIATANKTAADEKYERNLATRDTAKAALLQALGEPTPEPPKPPQPKPKPPEPQPPSPPSQAWVQRWGGWALGGITSAILAVVLWLNYAPTPAPGPGPVPPGPTPTPSPIPDIGLRVLIVYESHDASSLPMTQQSAIYGEEVQDFLKANCVKGPDGITPEYRIWDPNTPVSGASQIWQRMMARPRAELPWIVIANGRSGHEGPAPKTVEDMIALISRYVPANTRRISRAA